MGSVAKAAKTVWNKVLGKSAATSMKDPAEFYKAASAFDFSPEAANSVLEEHGGDQAAAMRTT